MARPIQLRAVDPTGGNSTMLEQGEACEVFDEATEGVGERIPHLEEMEAALGEDFSQLPASTAAVETPSTVQVGTTRTAVPTAQVPRPPPALPPNPSQTAVWVNTRSGVYHQPGTRWYGRTKEGTWMTLEQANDFGFRAAGSPRTTAAINPVVIEGLVAESAGASVRGPTFVSARAREPSAQITAIRPDLGEQLAYHRALLNGEYGLQRPTGANVRGVDFITAEKVFVAPPGGGPPRMQAIIYANDAKTSGVPSFESPGTTLKPSWRAEVARAISPQRLDLGDPQFEQAIRDAFDEGRVVLRQIDVDYSPTAGGQGSVTFR